MKYNYFDDLEKLSELTLLAVSVAVGTNTSEDITNIRKSADSLICKIESILFSDFLPPLERDNIAALAHSLSRVIDSASELTGSPPSAEAFIRSNEEAKICLLLGKELSRNVSMLRSVRNPKEMPNIKEFRSILAKGRAEHRRSMVNVRTNSSPRIQAEAVALIGKLRTELSKAFDRLIEIMLNNI